MAAYPNIKFYRREQAPSNPQEGYIWFDVTNKRLKIYKSNDWEDYSGKLVDASFANNTLTITKQDKTTVSVDLSALSTLDGKVTTLIGSDSNKSVRTIANEELAKVLLADGDDAYGAQKNFATLQELAAWIEKHPEDAAAMNADIKSIKDSYVSSLTDSAIYIELSNTKGSIALTDSALQTKIASLEEAISNASKAGVTSFGTKTGAITLKGNSTTNGTVNFAMNNNELTGTVYGLGTAAYTNSTAYATAAQGELASSALQKADIISGTTNGTIKVDGTEVAVKGLGSAAYTASTAYATSAQGDKADTALQSVSSNDSPYLTVSDKASNKQTITPVMGTFGGANGLATTANTAAYLSTYVDTVFSWAEY